MKKVILVIPIVICQISLAEQVMSFKDFLKSNLISPLKISKEVINLTDEQQNKIKNIAPNATETSYTFYYGKENDKLQKACVAVPQKGKEGPMTIGVCFLANGVVDKVEIIDFMEEKGKKAKDRLFLDQFKGKRANADFEVGKDINGITGATITSKAISEALRKSGWVFSNCIKGK